jgi:hypothetical protein
VVTLANVPTQSMHVSKNETSVDTFGWRFGQWCINDGITTIQYTNEWKSSSFCL